MNENTFRNNKTGTEARNRAAMVTRAARLSVIVHAAVFVVVNTMLLAVNLVMEHQFIEWPLMPWAAALAIHAVAVFLAPEVSRVRVRINRLELARARNH